MRTQTVVLSVLVRTTSVLTHAACLVAREQTVQFRIMWRSVGVLGGQQEILSETAGGSPGMRFVLLVEQTPTVRLGRMTVPSVDANQPTLEILFKDVVMNVTLMENVANPKNVTVSIIVVNLLVVMEYAVKMPTAKQSTIVHSALVLQTSLVILLPAATQSAPDIMTVHPTRLVSS